MKHEPECELAGLCDGEPHSGCSRTGNSYCIHCQRWCNCDKVRAAFERGEKAATERAMSALQDAHSKSDCAGMDAECRTWQAAIAAIRAAGADKERESDGN